jgi:hypothetical protein
LIQFLVSAFDYCGHAVVIQQVPEGVSRLTNNDRPFRRMSVAYPNQVMGQWSSQ